MKTELFLLSFVITKLLIDREYIMEWFTSAYVTNGILLTWFIMWAFCPCYTKLYDYYRNKKNK